MVCSKCELSDEREEVVNGMHKSCVLAYSERQDQIVYCAGQIFTLANPTDRPISVNCSIYAVCLFDGPSAPPLPTAVYIPPRSGPVVGA